MSEPRRWRWDWLGLAAGTAIGLGDIALMIALDADMYVGGRDATVEIVGAFALSYGFMGWAVGKLAMARARARRDADTIARQLADLERAQRDLVQQEKLAALGRLAAGVAHEVRNPLGVIRASAAMIRESFEPADDPHRACDFICEEIDRLNGLITSLLAFARPSDPVRTPVSLDKLIEHAAALAEPDLQGRRIRLERDVGFVPEIAADADLLGQVVYGLVGNAGDAVDDGGAIAIRARALPGGVRIEVIDDGPGVAEALREEIFEPFFTTRATGTGLGLAMARRIVEAHGGELGYVAGAGLARDGAGACFRIDLPDGSAESA